MAVTGIGNNYNVYESTYTSQKSEVAKQQGTSKAETRETKVAREEKARNSAGNKVSDYYSYLSGNYDCVKNGDVSISGIYLRECANNPEKAKELEENLSLFYELREKGYQNAKQNAKSIGARLVSYSESWSIDDTGNITMMASTTVTTDTKGWRELREEEEERLKEKREKEKEAKKAEEQKEEKRKQLEEMQIRKLEAAYLPEFNIGI